MDELLIPDLSGAVEVVLSDYSGYARMNDGAVEAWGSGVLSWDDWFPTPVTFPGLSGVVQIAVGQKLRCALIDDGTVKCWPDRGVSSWSTAGPVTVVRGSSSD